MPAEFTLFVKIADGYHVPAADPGDSPAARSLIPFRVGIVNGSGVAAYAGYPRASRTATTPPRVQGELRAERRAGAKGRLNRRPLVSVNVPGLHRTNECLAPVTIELDIAIDK